MNNYSFQQTRNNMALSTPTPKTFPETQFQRNLIHSFPMSSPLDNIHKLPIEQNIFNQNRPVDINPFLQEMVFATLDQNVSPSRSSINKRKRIFDSPRKRSNQFYTQKEKGSSTQKPPERIATRHISTPMHSMYLASKDQAFPEPEYNNNLIARRLLELQTQLESLDHRIQERDAIEKQVNLRYEAQLLARSNEVRKKEAEKLKSQMELRELERQNEIKAKKIGNLQMELEIAQRCQVLRRQNEAIVEEMMRRKETLEKLQPSRSFSEHADVCNCCGRNRSYESALSYTPFATEPAFYSPQLIRTPEYHKTGFSASTSASIPPQICEQVAFLPSAIPAAPRHMLPIVRDPVITAFPQPPYPLVAPPGVRSPAVVTSPFGLNINYRASAINRSPYTISPMFV